jgi:hypothetical protein
MLCKTDILYVGLQQLREMWTKYFKTSPDEEDEVEMTGGGEGSGRAISSRTRQQSEPHHLKHRLISLMDGFWKNQFRTSRMTTSTRTASLTIGMTRCQGTLM